MFRCLIEPDVNVHRPDLERQHRQLHHHHLSGDATGIGDLVHADRPIDRDSGQRRHLRTRSDDHLLVSTPETDVGERLRTVSAGQARRTDVAGPRRLTARPRDGCAMASTPKQRSDRCDSHVAGVRGKRLDVVLISGENRSTRLGERHHDRVHRRTSAGSPTQLGRSSRDRFRNPRLDDARLQKAVRVRITTCVTMKRLDQHHCREHWRP